MTNKERIEIIEEVRMEIERQLGAPYIVDMIELKPKMAQQLVEVLLDVRSALKRDKPVNTVEVIDRLYRIREEIDMLDNSVLEAIDLAERVGE